MQKYKISSKIVEICRQNTLSKELSLHGLAHHSRVHLNAKLICMHHSEVNFKVCSLFAFLHDIGRLNDGIDIEHGDRSSLIVKEIGSCALNLDIKGFDQLVFAIKHHSDGYTSKDMTIGACWDADRLDLYRVGIMPKSEKLNTAYAKQIDVIESASNRSANWVKKHYNNYYKLMGL